MQPMRVFLADDHALIRAGLRAALASTPDLMLVGEAVEGYNLASICRASLPDVIVLDLHMPGPPINDLIAELKSACPTSHLLILSAYDDDVYVRSTLMAGVKGYALKDEHSLVIMQAIRTVAQGQSWFSQSVASKVARWQSGEQAMSLPALSARERQVLRCVMNGKSNREIALVLGISEKSVERAVSKLLAKMGTSTRVEAVVRAVRAGLV